MRNIFQTGWHFGIFFSRCKENTAISNCSSREQVFPQLSGHLCQLLRLWPGRGGSKMRICWMWAEKSAAANSNNRRRWDEKYLKAHYHPAVTPLLPHSRQLLLLIALSLSIFSLSVSVTCVALVRHLLLCVINWLALLSIHILHFFIFIIYFIFTDDKTLW